MMSLRSSYSVNFVTIPFAERFKLLTLPLPLLLLLAATSLAEASNTSSVNSVSGAVTSFSSVTSSLLHRHRHRSLDDNDTDDGPCADEIYASGLCNTVAIFDGTGVGSGQAGQCIDCMEDLNNLLTDDSTVRDVWAVQCGQIDCCYEVGSPCAFQAAQIARCAWDTVLGDEYGPLNCDVPPPASTGGGGTTGDAGTVTTPPPSLAPVAASPASDPVATTTSTAAPIADTQDGTAAPPTTTSSGSTADAEELDVAAASPTEVEGGGGGGSSGESTSAASRLGGDVWWNNLTLLLLLLLLSLGAASATFAVSFI